MALVLSLEFGQGGRAMVYVSWAGKQQLFFINLGELL